MRNTGPFSQYNRHVIRYGLRGDDGTGLGARSLLAGFAAQEARLLREFVIWAKCETLDLSGIQLPEKAEARKVYLMPSVKRLYQ